MKELQANELLDVKGGAGLNATFLAALVRGVNSFLDVGRSLGSAIRRTIEGNVCPL